MMRSILTSMVFLSLLAFAGSAWSLTVGLTDVGAVDAKIAETTQLNGDDANLTWVRSILGNDITFVIKHDQLTALNWSETNEVGTWAFSLSDSPDYFLVKTGNNQTNNFRDYLFVNNDSKSWAVLDLDDIYVTQVTNIGKVSHLSEYNGAPVPEPGAILLLGGGLLSLAVFGRRRMKA